METSLHAVDGHTHRRHLVFAEVDFAVVWWVEGYSCGVGPGCRLLLVLVLTNNISLGEGQVARMLTWCLQRF
jgi:hypothetical protein